MRDPGIAAARSSFLCACAVLQGHFHPVVQAESVACLQQLHLFSPPDTQLEMAASAAVPPMLYRSLRSPHLVLRQAAVACLRQLAQREAKEVSEKLARLLMTQTEHSLLFSFAHTLPPSSKWRRIKTEGDASMH